ncbi:MAG: DSD1 family PLP-dependent enzyme [Candidatus Glassbacteria bacterium]|nr:DSD1 family PLP-dependent enzyme [Candidatus Glassbacteria bacterium]
MKQHQSAGTSASGFQAEKHFIGKSLEDLPTPVIVADLEALEANLSLMAGYFAGRHCRLRPHFKSHKCITLARRQLAAGNASGITCAKVSEAERLVSGGVRDVLIANQVIGQDKVRRVAELNRRAAVRILVDSPEGVGQISCAAAEKSVTVGVLVEVDIGMNRCGVPPGEPALELAGMAAMSRGLRFDGLQGYEGHLVGLEDYRERKRKVCKALESLVATRKLVEDAGLPVVIVSAGGTGTYTITGNFEGIDEIQPGSYALMDSFYRKITPEFRLARFILATVISRQGQRAVADVGLKGMGSEYADAAVAGFPEAKVLYVAEEHLPIEPLAAEVGDRVRIIPPHGCTTNNLHERMWIARGGIIEDVWDIEGRGCLE